jgi:hypothetical protein
MQIIPIEFEVGTGAPRDPHLYDALQKYFEQEFGSRQLISNNIKTWAVVEHDNDGYKILGVTALRYMIDCPMFHVSEGRDEETWKRAVEARDMLFNRARAFLQDQAGTGTRVMVYVAPLAQRLWKGFLKKAGAVPANRFEVGV